MILLLACAPGEIHLDSADTDTDTDTDTDSDTDADSDTDTDTDTPVPPVAEGLWVEPEPHVQTVLRATWTQLADAETWLSWEFEGEHTSPVRTTLAGDGREAVLGLPPDTEVTVTLHTRTDEGEGTLSRTVSTGSLPTEALAPDLLIAAVGMDTAPYLLTSVNTGDYNYFGPCWVVILDRQGRVIWYRQTSENRLTLFPRVSQDGTHLVFEGSGYYVDASPSILRTTLSLRDVEEIDTPYLGFTFDELDDGSLLYDESADGYAYWLTRQYPDGTTERIWDCGAWMEDWQPGYWACAVNTVLYDADAGVVIWSMFETSTVVGIDLESGAPLWSLGERPGGLTLPEDVALELQHYPNFTPDGTLLLTSHVPGRPREQHIREFGLDLDAGSATQVWDYVPASGAFGQYGGEAVRLAGGNTLVGFGTDGVVQEVTPSGEVVWELDWHDHLVGHFSPIDDLYALDAGW